MGPKRKPVTAATTPPKPPQPMKAFGMSRISNDEESKALFSPHDSLAKADGKSTAYFLRFSAENLAPPVKTKPTVSPKKPIVSPKKPAVSPKKPIITPKKPHPAVKSPGAASSKSKSKIPISKRIAQRPVSPITKRVSRRSMSPVTKRTTGRPVSPAARKRAEHRLSDGFRTRSVSPKILKREDITDMDKNGDMMAVVDKCNKLLKTLSRDSSHPFTKLPSSNSLDAGDPVGDLGRAEDSVLGHVNLHPIMAGEPDNKGTNNNTNNAYSDTKRAAIERVESPTFIDQGENNQLNNVGISYQLATTPASHTNNSEKATAVATLTSTSRTEAVEVTLANASPQILDTVHLFEVSSGAPCSSSILVHEDIDGDRYKLASGCQVSNESKNLAKSETERDSASVEHGKVVVGDGSVTHLTHTHREEDSDSERSLAREEISQEPREAIGKHLPKSGNGAGRPSMSSSWMDRLKEDLDNDDEWLSEEEEFQREQEAKKLRAAAQQRTVLAEAESSSEDEQQQRSRPTAAPRPAQRGQSLPLDTRSPQQREDDWSDDDADDEEPLTGFRHNQRNEQLRKSINRTSCSTEDYSSDEELVMSGGARAGSRRAAARHEPDQEEMDMMVKKNLAYVNSQELDKLDILTSDLDVAPDQLHLEQGVGQMLPDDENHPGGFDMKEDDDGDQIEVSGTLEVVGIDSDSSADADGEEVKADHVEQSRWNTNLHVLEYIGDEENASQSDTDSESRGSGSTATCVESLYPHVWSRFTNMCGADLLLQDQSTSRNELISALADDLIQSDECMDTYEGSPACGSGKPDYIEEELLSPTDKHGLGMEPSDGTEPQTDEMDEAKPPVNYSTQVIRPSRSGGWRRQLSEKLSEWEDELPNPYTERAAASREYESKDEAVTSFLQSDEDDRAGDEPPTSAAYDRSKSTEEEIREKVEDCMHEKIRGWKNMTAESAAGQVDEWQSLGNFNVSREPAGTTKRRGSSEDSSVPVEKRRDVLSGRRDSGEYADINSLPRQTSSYDGDIDGDDDMDDRAALDSDEGALDEDGEGYLSDSSSQDTIREGTAQHQNKHSSLIVSGSVSDEEDGVSGVAAVDELSSTNVVDEPGYVEILGGEEPPDEWLNLGPRRERISSSSSSSDGSGFQYIAASNRGPYIQSSGEVRPQLKVESDDDIIEASLPSIGHRERMSTPPLAVSPTPDNYRHEAEGEKSVIEPPYSLAEDVYMKRDVRESHDLQQTEEAMSHHSEEVVTEEEGDIIEVVGDQRAAELPSPEPAPQRMESISQPSPHVQTPRNNSSSSDSSEEGAETKAPSTDTKPPVPTPRKDSYDRVEKLREEMRSAAFKGKSQSVDLPSPRQSRSTERFTERMKSLEKTKAARERRTPTPTGLTGKFSAAFSRFESPDEKRNASRKVASPLTTSVASKSKDTSAQAINATPTVVKVTKPAVDPEVIQPVQVKQVKSAAVIHVQSEKSAGKPRTTSLTRHESVDESTTPESKSKRLERSKTFDTGVPSRHTPSGSKVLERMAKFGQSVDVPGKSHQTVTTKNNDTDRFERRTHVDSNVMATQPHFDVDIRISREPLDDADVVVNSSPQHPKTTAITVSKDKVRVGQFVKQQTLPTSMEDERKEEYLNVWDTEIPVTDRRNKQVLSPRRLHISSVSKEIKSHDKTPNRSAINRSKSEPRFHRQATSLQNEEVSITVRPQHVLNQNAAAPSRGYADSAAEKSRMRSSIALNPKDEIIQPSRVASRQYANPEMNRTQSTSPTRRSPERDHQLNKADSLDELRNGQLVAQTKNMFSKGEASANRYLPINYSKAYATRKPEPFTRGASERSWDNRRRERNDMMSDAVRDLAGAYDQEENDSRHDYNIGYSRESLEYTRKWVENNEIAPSQISMPATLDEPRVVQQPGSDRIADPVKDDAMYRRIRQANRSSVPKHFSTPSQITLSSASPEPSVVSDGRGRARSTDHVRDRSGRPKGRSKSLPRKKPSKAIADRASVFSSNDQPMARREYVEEIKPSTGRPLYSSNGRHSTSPRPVTQKERLAARRLLPAPRDPDEVDQGSPRAPSKGVAIMVELYNKSKGGDSVLADVNEQTLASVDDGMFKQGANISTSPPAVDETPLSSQAWKTWLGNTDRSALEQKVEKAYNKHAQPSGPPVKRDAKPLVNSGWQQRSVVEDPMPRPVFAPQPQSSIQLSSPPRPAKSDQAMQAAQRRAWRSASPPAPTLPQRGYSADPYQGDSYTGPQQEPSSAFDSYKQQSLQRFRQEEQYATVVRPQRAPEPLRQAPHTNAPQEFDQALLMQAPPPKPERLYNTAEPWEAYQPTEYPTTNSLQGYQPKPTQYSNDPRTHRQYPEERQSYPAGSSGYPDRPHSQQQREYTDYRDYPNQHQKQQQQPPAGQQRYDELGYTQQPYRGPDQGHVQVPKQSYPYREPGYDSRGYQQPGLDSLPYNSYPDQVDSYRYNTGTARKEPRYPHEQPPRGPIPDPRYPQTNGVRSPPPQQTDPRYGAFDPRLETGDRRPRRTNSVPNIKQHIMSPPKNAHPQSLPYNPRYHDQYMEDRTPQRPPPSSQHGSLPRASKQKEKTRSTKTTAGLPEFIPIQYATGKYQTPRQQPQSYNTYHKQPSHSNYPSTANNNRYNYPNANGHAYPANGHGHPTNGHAYPNNPGHPYLPNGGHISYPLHDDAYHQRPSRPGVGVIYNPGLGISDF